MNDFYQDVMIGIDRRIYARNDAYKHLTRTEQVIDQFTLINKIERMSNNITTMIEVPPMRELLWIDRIIYLGITVDGELFSFYTGELVSLESPIISAYATSVGYQSVILLLENGRVRLVNVDGYTNRLISINHTRIDREIPDHVIILSSLHLRLTVHQARLTRDQNSEQCLIITADNQIRDIYMYVDDPETIFGPEDYYLTSGDTIDDHSIDYHSIDYHDIIVARNGSILMNDDSIFSIKEISHDEEGYNEETPTYRLYRIEHSIIDIIDILPLSNDRMVMLTRGNQLWIAKSNIDDQLITSPDIVMIRPIKLLTYHWLYEGVNYNEVVISINDIYILGSDGGIYLVNEDGEVVQQDIPTQLLSTRSLTTKRSRTPLIQLRD